MVECLFSMQEVLGSIPRFSIVHSVLFFLFYSGDFYLFVYYVINLLVPALQNLVITSLLYCMILTPSTQHLCLEDEGMWCLSVRKWSISSKNFFSSLIKLYTRPSCCNRNFTSARHTGTQASLKNLEMCK